MLASGCRSRSQRPVWSSRRSGPDGATPALLDRITVDYYHTPTPLRKLATIGTPEPRLLTVQPYDKSSIKTIEKAILESDVGLTPSNDGRRDPPADPGADRGSPASSL